MFLLIGTGFLATGIKRLVPEAEQLPSSSAKVKNEWSSTHSTIRLQEAERINLTLYFQERIALPCNGIATVKAERCAGCIRISEGI